MNVADLEGDVGGDADIEDALLVNGVGERVVLRWPVGIGRLFAREQLRTADVLAECKTGADSEKTMRITKSPVRGWLQFRPCSEVGALNFALL